NESVKSCQCTFFIPIPVGAASLRLVAQASVPHVRRLRLHPGKRYGPNTLPQWKLQVSCRARKRIPYLPTDSANPHLRGFPVQRQFRISSSSRLPRLRERPMVFCGTALVPCIPPSSTRYVQV